MESWTLNGADFVCMWELRLTGCHRRSTLKSRQPPSRPGSHVNAQQGVSQRVWVPHRVTEENLLGSTTYYVGLHAFLLL